MIRLDAIWQHDMKQHTQQIQLSGVFQNLRKTKLIVMRVIGLLVSGIILFVVYRRLEPGALAESLKQANAGWIFLSFSAFGLNLIFASYRWHLMLRLNDSTVHPGATLRAVTLGHCFNTFLFGAAGGDLVKSMVYSGWYRLTLTDVLAMAPLDRIFGLIGALVFGFSMVMVGFVSGGFDTFQWSQLRLPIFWALGLVLALTGSMWALSRWKGKGTSKLGVFLNQLRKGGGILWSRPKVAIKAAAAATVVHLCLSLVMVFNLKAVSQISFEWWDVLWIFPVISMISGLPISIGGAGLREGTALLLLGIYAIPGEDAVMASLLTLGVYFLWAFVGLVVWQLEEWRQRKAISLPENPSVSIVIPTLNEANRIDPLADHLKEMAPETEWILADGGSQDDTLLKAKQHRFKILTCPKGRGIQMHHGAAAASGDVILFLHADTQLPPNGIQAMLRCLKDAYVVGGGFWKQFDKSHWIMNGSRFRCLPRVFLGRYVFGDQCLFVRRDILNDVGGVPKVPLMEEFELCRQLRSQGRIALADATVTTSSRRFLAHGIIKTYLLMGRIMLRYKMGHTPDSLAEAYARSKNK